MKMPDTVPDPSASATFRRYQTADYDQVAGLWTRVNRELAPSDIYLDRDYRGRGLAPRMLSHVEGRARELGFSKMIVSTAEVQKAALRFYQSSGFRHVRTEVATTTSAKQAGGGLKRFHFEKSL
jgi:GNAT superfamily N-acetyltransferase